mmetsp:Transcript_38079/g.41275  ORF Transcript_38079/g.41275 Transcript_38079/m.41275 type:complete len:268 (+) Transcript_38079:230-1033(+)
MLFLSLITRSLDLFVEHGSQRLLHHGLLVLKGPSGFEEGLDPRLANCVVLQVLEHVRVAELSLRPHEPVDDLLHLPLRPRRERPPRRRNLRQRHGPRRSLPHRHAQRPPLVVVLRHPREHLPVPQLQLHVVQHHQIVAPLRRVHPLQQRRLQVRHEHLHRARGAVREGGRDRPVRGEQRRVRHVEVAEPSLDGRDNRVREERGGELALQLLRRGVAPDRQDRRPRGAVCRGSVRAEVRQEVGESLDPGPLPTREGAGAAAGPEEEGR